MRQFASGGFRLWNLAVEAKVLYTAFCGLILCGIVSSALYYGDLVGGGLGGVRRYYGGEENVPPIAAPTAPPGGATPTGTAGDPARIGPAIDVPVDIEAQREPIVVAVTYRKLLEVTHFHLFTMPVVLLIVGHLFFATALGARAKLAWVGTASATVVLHIATPWLVRYLTPQVAILHAVSGAAMTLSMGVLTIYPIIVMWRPVPARPAAAATD
jgi:hypothetical protein